MPITIFDGIVIGVVLFSAVLAMVRGFSREILSIVSWGGSAVAAYYLYPKLVPYAKHYTDDDRIAIVGSAAVVFLIALIIISFITMKIADFIIDSRIGALDRTLGFLSAPPVACCCWSSPLPSGTGSSTSRTAPIGSTMPSPSLSSI